MRAKAHSFTMDLLITENSIVRYQVGNPHFEGQTSVVIQGNGAASVEFARELEKQAYTKQLDSERLDEIRAILSVNDPRKLTASQNDPVPDEAAIQIEIIDGAQSWSGTFRDQDRWNQFTLRKDIELFESLAREISGGQIRF
jgi:hypothetical protein